MSGDDRQYWPTDSKLAELRESGEVPYSPVVALSVASLAMIGALYALASRGPAFLASYQEILRAPAPTAEHLQLIGGALLQIVFLPVAIVTASVVAAGLLQTRFWFGGSRLGLDLSRVLPRIAPLNPLTGIFSAIGRLAGTVIIVAGAGGITVWMFRSVLPLLNANRASAGAWIAQLANQAALAAAAAFFGLALVGFLLSRLHFRYRNRMTRQEMEQDMRNSGT